MTALSLLALALTAATLIAIRATREAARQRDNADRAIEALGRMYGTRQSLADAIDALDAMQRSAEGYKHFSEELMKSLEVERAYSARWELATAAAEATADALQEKWIAAVQAQLHAGCRIIIDHAGRPTP